MIDCSGSSQSSSEATLDPCGLRFLLAARHHSYLFRCLPPTQRVALKKQGISSSLLAWAFHSESQDELLQLLPVFNKGITVTFSSRMITMLPYGMVVYV